MIDWTTYSKHTDTEIKGFFGEYRWLSNFHKSEVWHRGNLFCSVENAFQSTKANSYSKIEQFRKCEPFEAKKLGRDCVLPYNWEEIKVGIMAELIMQKFLTNPELKTKLLNTGSKYLEETNAWKDTFWGVYYKTGQGQNVLGKLLMATRDFLQKIS